MNTQSIHIHATNHAVPADDVFVSTLVPARHWIASIAAVLMTTLTLAVVNAPVHMPAAGTINGIHVTNLAPVMVNPSAAEQRDAALPGNAVFGSIVLPALGSSSGERTARIGSQLAMPYYSFGNQFGSASKE